MIKKLRLDKILVCKGLAHNSNKAKAIIMAGKVIVNGIKVDKSGVKFPLSVEIRVITKGHEWVSRGGIKLSYAINNFNLNITGLICADIGASTGGFTEVLLKNKADKVYSIDVGKGQLDWKLVSNKKVIILDKTNAKYLNLEEVDQGIDLITCDVSFISITKALSNIIKFNKENLKLVALIKPQFELSREKIGKKGVVTDINFRLEAVDKVKHWLEENGWKTRGLIESPIKGTKGNIEYLIHSTK